MLKDRMAKVREKGVNDPKVIVIFPAKNEEGTIEKAISTAKQSYYKPEILVVDAYSTDKIVQ